MDKNSTDRIPDFFPISDGRTYGYSTLSAKNWPLASMVSNAWLTSSRGTDWFTFRDVFCNQWKIYQNVLNVTSVGDYLGLARASRSQRALPHWAAVSPWDPMSLSEMYRWLPARVRKNRKSNGLDLPKIAFGKNLMRLDALHGANSHAVQYFELMHSISAEGFWESPNSSDPLLVKVLRKGASQRWMIWSGSHRVVSASVLEIEGVHGHVIEVVRREEAPYWPNVQNGCFAVDQALSIFDSLFESRALDFNNQILTALGEERNRK